MTLLRRIPALILAVLLAVGIGPAPTLLLAAPALQETEPAIVGYYESDVLPGGDNTPDLVVGLILYDDGSAEVLSTYDNDEDVIVEVGTWVDNGDETVTLTVTGTEEDDYASPIALDFEVGEDGSLIVPGLPDGVFGEAGLVLAPTELGNDVLAQIPDEAVIYQSEVIESASSPGLQLTLALFDDNSLTLFSDYLNPGEVVIEVGTWVADEDGNLIITLTGQVADGEGTITDFEAPLEFDFTNNGDDSLSLVDEGGALFGDEGLTLLLIQEGFTITGEAGAAEADAEEEPAPEEEIAPEEVAEDEVTEDQVTEEEAADAAGIDELSDVTPSGAYVSDILPSSDDLGTFLVAIFYDDGNILITTYPLDGTLPILEVGAWADNLDGTYAITVTGTPEEEYDAPVELEFTVDEEGVISLSDVPLYPLEDIDLSAAPSLFAEFRSDEITDTLDLPHTITLSLYDDADLSATMVTEYTEDGELYVEYGNWVVSADDQLVVTLIGDDDVDYDEPVEWIFDVSDDGVLTLANDDDGYYGDAGLILLPFEAAPEGTEEAAEDAPADTSADAEEITESEEITGTDEVTDTEEVTDTAEIVDTEEVTGTDEISGEIDMTAVEGIQIFQSDLLPAASSPGLQLTLGLLDDGSVAMDYDYQNDEEVITSLGEWVDNGDGTITLTFTEGPNGLYDAPVTLVLELGDDGNLTIIDASEESLGLLDVSLAPIVLE